MAKNQIALYVMITLSLLISSNSFCDQGSLPLTHNETVTGNGQIKETDKETLNWTDPATGMVFVWVSGGCYQMGCGAWCSDCQSDEKPVHEVCVDGYWIGKYEVTQGQWEKIMRYNPSRFIDCGTDCPVEQVSWDDINRFVSRLNRRSGKNKFRLPTEAEWEYASRSRGKNERYSGGNHVGKVSWYNANSGGKTHPVGRKLPNGLGIYDMSGNVLEWCLDVYANDAYRKHNRKNPVYTGEGLYRVIRGGSWDVAPVDARTTGSRINNSPGYKIDDIGFRLVRRVP